jgi:hypothetical protein
MKTLFSILIITLLISCQAQKEVSNKSCCTKKASVEKCTKEAKQSKCCNGHK